MMLASCLSKLVLCHPMSMVKLESDDMLFSESLVKWIKASINRYNNSKYSNNLNFRCSFAIETWWKLKSHCLNKTGRFGGPKNVIRHGASNSGVISGRVQSRGAWRQAVLVSILTSRGITVHSNCNVFAVVQCSRNSTHSDHVSWKAERLQLEQSRGWPFRSSRSRPAVARSALLKQFQVSHERLGVWINSRHVLLLFRELILWISFYLWCMSMMRVCVHIQLFYLNLDSISCLDCGLILEKTSENSIFVIFWRELSPFVSNVLLVWGQVWFAESIYCSIFSFAWVHTVITLYHGFYQMCHYRAFQSGHQCTNLHLHVMIMDVHFLADVYTFANMFSNSWSVTLPDHCV